MRQAGGVALSGVRSEVRRITPGPKLDAIDLGNPLEVPASQPPARASISESTWVESNSPRTRTTRSNFETATTLPTFTRFRARFNTTLAESGMNLQQAMHVTGHADAKTHMRYVRRRAAMRAIPTRRGLGCRRGRSSPLSLAVTI